MPERIICRLVKDLREFYQQESEHGKKKKSLPPRKIYGNLPDVMKFLALNTVLAVVPALLLILLFYRKDSQKPEPGRLIWKTFLLGFFSVLPALLLELLLNPLSGYYSGWGKLVIQAFVVAGMVEEGIKLLTVRLYVFPRPAFDEINDGIVYTITASMGFACFENIMYSFGPASTILIRGFTAVPLHAFASGIMGYYIGRARFREGGYLLKGFLLAAAIHGLYDFFLFAGGAFSYLVFPLLVLAGRALFRLNRRALAEDRAAGRS